MDLFSEEGRRVPSQAMRVFSDTPNFFTALIRRIFNIRTCGQDFIKVAWTQDLSASEFKRQTEQLIDIVAAGTQTLQIFCGAFTYLVVSVEKQGFDLGGHLEHSLLPKLEQAFLASIPSTALKQYCREIKRLTGNFCCKSLRRL